MMMILVCVGDSPHSCVRLQMLQITMGTTWFFLSTGRSGPCIALNMLQRLQRYEGNETHCRANDTCPIWYGAHLYCITLTAAGPAGCAAQQN